MFQKLYSMIAGVLFVCTGSICAARVSHSAPWGSRIQKEPPQRWRKQSVRRKNGVDKNFLAGLRLGYGSFSGASSILVWKDPGTNFSTLVDGKILSPWGWFGSCFVERTQRFSYWRLGCNGGLGWSSVRANFSQVLASNDRGPCRLQQMGFADCGLIVVYARYPIAPLMRLGGVLSQFKYTMLPGDLCEDALSKIFLAPGLFAECGLEVSWRRLGVRLSYKYTLYRRWERSGYDPLFAVKPYATHKISGLEQHTVALSTFVRF